MICQRWIAILVLLTSSTRCELAFTASLDPDSIEDISIASVTARKLGISEQNVAGQLSEKFSFFSYYILVDDGR